MTNPGIVDDDELLNSRILTFDINRSDGGWLGLGRSGPSRPFPWIHDCVMGSWLSLLMKWILFKLFTVWQCNNALLHLSLSCSDLLYFILCSDLALICSDAFWRMNVLSHGSLTASIHPATPWPKRLKKWLDSSIHPILLFRYSLEHAHFFSRKRKVRSIYRRIRSFRYQTETNLKTKCH